MTDLEPIPERALVTRGELAQIQSVLLAVMERIPQMDTPQAADLWRSADIIGRDLATLKHDASNRMIEVAPTEEYRWRGEGRTRPVKVQLVDGVGTVKIEQSPTRTWADRRALAHEMFDVWKQDYAKGHQGEHPEPHEVIDFVMNVFQVGDPRTTVMEDQGLKDFDEEPYVAKTFERKARVVS